MDPTLCGTFWHLEFHEQDTGLFHDLARGDGVSALRLALGGRAGRSIRYRECLVPQGYDDELRAVFRSGDSTWGAMAIYREGVRSPFDADDVAVVRSISPIVADALRIHVRRAVPWLEPSAPGLVVVGESGRIESANREAVEWLRLLWPRTADGDGAGVNPTALLELRDRGIGVPTPLFALVAKAHAVAEGRERGPARLRLRDDRGRWIVLHATAVSGPATTGPAVAVVIESAKSAEVAPIIIDAYWLSPREREVLGAIARGASTAEIAAELFLSGHTVRDYVKTVFEKLGVSSRGEPGRPALRRALHRRAPRPDGARRLTASTGPEYGLGGGRCDAPRRSAPAADWRDLSEAGSAPLRRDAPENETGTSAAPGSCPTSAKSHPGAAAIVREGLFETLTVTRLGVPPTLARTSLSSSGHPGGFSVRWGGSTAAGWLATKGVIG